MSKALFKSSDSSELLHYWESHVINWECSNLTQKEYCQRHNLNNKSFWYWKNKLRPSPKSESSLQFIELSNNLFLNQKSSDQSSTPGFHVPQFPSTSSSYNLRLWIDSIHCIEIGDNFSPEVLSRLVGFLRRV